MGGSATPDLPLRSSTWWAGEFLAGATTGSQPWATTPQPPFSSVITSLIGSSSSGLTPWRAASRPRMAPQKKWRSPTTCSRSQNAIRQSLSPTQNLHRFSQRTISQCVTRWHGCASQFARPALSGSHQTLSSRPFSATRSPSSMRQRVLRLFERSILPNESAARPHALRAPLPIRLVFLNSAV